MNAGEFRHKIIIQIRTGNTNSFTNYYSCYAKINASSGNEFVAGGVTQSSSDCIFTVRYCDKLKNMYLNSQSYRILFQDGTFDVKKTDNYMFLNQYLQILATGKIVR